MLVDPRQALHVGRARRAASSPAVVGRDLVCLSHLRWDFVYQRPQHIMSRFAAHGRVFFVEEPQLETCPAPRWQISARGDGVQVAVPVLPSSMPAGDREGAQAMLLDELFLSERIEMPILWYYTPMALAFTQHLGAAVVVYDCMDDLASFKDAPPLMSVREARLFQRADVVFTGGQSLYEAKRSSHSNVHPFPSSVDRRHFGAARLDLPEPADQAPVPSPQIGFFGVIDERMDIDLLAGIADKRPDWQLILIGPVVKIDPASLPQRPNVRYLGARAYDELPRYIGGWNVAMLPFARNDATRYISPTKVPEYLAAGKPVVSTAIRDVVTPYEALGLVRIANEPADFVRAIEEALADGADPSWSRRVDAALTGQSWDRTWSGMVALMEDRVTC